MATKRLPPNFGRAWSCVGDLTSPAILVSGFRVVAEAAARRLSTPRGRLLSDPNYGYDLGQFLNDDLATEDIARIQSQAAAELLKDERITAATVSITLVSGVMSVIVAIGTANGPFTLVLQIDDVTTDILSPQAS